MNDCVKVLRVLKDEEPHRNFDIINMFGGGFALAARIRDLRSQGYMIASGPPNKFGKERQDSGDWWYQLTLSAITRDKLQKMHLDIENFTSPIQLHLFKPLTRKYIKTHRRKLDRMLG